MRRLSTLLLGAGVLAGALGALGIALGMWANLPPAAVRAIAMALPFVLAGALLTVGAVLGRAATRAQPSPPVDQAALPTGTAAPPRLDPGARPLDVPSADEAAPVPRGRAT